MKLIYLADFDSSSLLTAEMASEESMNPKKNKERSRTAVPDLR
jgi:hypothetical protein